MTEPAWAALAATAIARLHRHVAEADPDRWPGKRPEDLEDASEPDAGDLAAEGAEPAGGASATIPAGVLALTLRLCATLGSAEAAAAVFRPGAITIIAHGDVAPERLRRIIDRALLPEGDSSSGRSWGEGLLCLSASPGDSHDFAQRRIFGSEFEAAIAGSRRLLLLIATPALIPERLRPVLPAPLPLAPLDRALLVRLLRLSHGADPADDALQASLPEDAALARLDEMALLAALRAPTAAGVIARLRRACAPPVAAASTGPTLAAISGYGEAEAIARHMVADLQAWQAGRISWHEAQRAVLFHGPPGTGKSFLARAMAGSAGITLVQASFARWQAAGHLGHMLAAMRASFAEAAARAPAIIVIDEIDAMGSRDDPDPHNASYRRQVINAFLEALDGLAGTEGVLLVGTCNHPHVIDPAALRPGRFDAVAAVPLPGRAAIARMLEDGVRTAGITVAAEGMASLIRAATGQSAAAIEAALRAAGAAARGESRKPGAADLLAALGGDHRVPAIERRIAVHECGHAVVATALGLGHARRLLLDADGGSSLFAQHQQAGLLGEVEAGICQLLAGRAAERLIFGAPSAGAGGPDRSDLARATAAAVAIDATLGLGSEGPLWRAYSATAWLQDPSRAARVRARLEAAEARAATILGRNRALLLAMAEALLKAGEMDGPELASWLQRVRPGPELEPGAEWPDRHPAAPEQPLPPAEPVAGSGP